MMKLRRCVIFGGTGFIGSHFAQHLTSSDLAEEIILADIAPVRPEFSFDDKRVRYVKLDVRDPSERWSLPGSVDLIANFAAVHREPGHEWHEYYGTNLAGAEHVCSWAERVDCKRIIFTSSISPYGPTESVKTETSPPAPISPYGASKLVAEKIHIGWQRAASGRRLVIVRPGVVFGPGERGNVTRLVKAVNRRYFFYLGNRRVRKAGGYVKELTNSMLWALERTPETGGVFLYNFAMEHAPAVEDYVKTVCKVAEIERFLPNVPHVLLLSAAYVARAITKPFGITQPLDPVRVRKLTRSNNIEPAVLKREGYSFQYTLESAMRDWRNERPDEWR